MGTTAREKPSQLHRCAPKHERLFEDLARHLYAGVYNYLCWMSRDRALAEELTQETFVQAWQNIEGLRSESAAQAWLYRIARNRFLQHARRSQLPTVPLEDCLEHVAPAPAATQPDRAAERADLCRTVHEALQALPEAYREVIVLHNVEHLSLAHVAQVLDVPLGTVKSRRARAFNMLRCLLSSEVGHDEM
jgi:RNA polymerase sigma-70 factor (ECF subfamily)